MYTFLSILSTSSPFSSGLSQILHPFVLFLFFSNSVYPLTQLDISIHLRYAFQGVLLNLNVPAKKEPTES